MQGILRGHPAGRIVVDDGGGGAVEFADEIPCGVEIHEIIIGKFLALDLAGRGQAGGGFSGFGV